MTAFALRDPFRVVVTDSDGNSVAYGNVVAVVLTIGDGRTATFGDLAVEGPPAPEDRLPLVEDVIDWRTRLGGP